MNGDDYNGAEAYALEMRGIFGEDFYLELQDHGIAEQTEVNRGLLAARTGRNGDPWCVPMMPTICGRRMQKTTTCCCVSRPARRWMTRTECGMSRRNFYIRSTRGDGDAVRRISGRGGQHGKDRGEDASWSSPSASTTCRNFPAGGVRLRLHICGNYVMRGLLGGTVRQSRNIGSTLDYELDMIEKMGFTDYFLIVSDFVRYAKSQGIPVGPGRGSAPDLWCLTAWRSRTSIP